MRVTLLTAFLLLSKFAFAGADFDRDVYISSASQVDGAWSVWVCDSSSGKTSFFAVGKTKSRGGMTLISFDEKECSAWVETPRGRLHIALAQKADSQAGDTNDAWRAQQYEADEIVAASNGRVTPRYRASLWRRTGE